MPTLEEFSQLLGLPILEQVPFTGLEQDPASEDVVVALHLKPSDIESNWEKRSEVKGLLANFLIKKAHIFLDAIVIMPSKMS